MIKIYTDGACIGNPGPGGWGVLLIDGETRTDMSGGQKNTTNNQMEMMAVIQALEHFPESTELEIHTDSKYVVDGLKSWLSGWKKNGWKTANKKPVKNKDLWIRLDEAFSFHKATIHWVKGHAGHPENEHVDALANAAATKFE